MRTSPEIAGAVLEALEQSPDPVFIADAEGAVLYANPACAGFPGAPARNGRAAASEILKSVERPEEFRAGIERALSEGVDWTGRFTGRSPDGTGKIWSVRLSPVRVPAGGTARYLASARDVTLEAGREERLARERVLEALGRLAGRLAHDLNNLLTIIIGSIELIIEEAPAEGLSAKLGRGILQTAKESASSLKHLLVFAGRREYAPVTAPLGSIIEKASQRLAALLGPEHSIEYSLAPKLARVSIGPEELAQVLEELVLNARDAMPSGGRIGVAAYNKTAGRNGPDGLKEGDYAVLEISDSGAGIAPEAMERLFEPFFTTKAKEKDAGLGLPAVYGTIRQHNGGIVAEPRPGGGTIFRIYLPKAA